MSIASSIERALLRALLAGVLALASVGAYAQLSTSTGRDYILGKEASESGNHQDAIHLLTKVVANNPTPKESAKLSARIFGPNLPQLYLGVSLAATGNCANAVVQLQNTALASVTRQLPKEEKLRSDTLQRCQTTLAAATPPPPPQPPATTPPQPPPEPVASTTQRPAASETPPVAAQPPPTPIAVATPPPAAAPAPDPWITERARIRALIVAYLDDRLTLAAIPDESSFQSIKGRQWSLLLRVLIQGRDAAITGQASSPALQKARNDIATAKSLGPLPNWQELASPRIRALVGGT